MDRQLLRWWLNEIILKTEVSLKDGCLPSAAVCIVLTRTDAGRLTTVNDVGDTVVKWWGALKVHPLKNLTAIDYDEWRNFKF